MGASDLAHLGLLGSWTSQQNLPVRLTIKTRKGTLDGVLAAQDLSVREGMNLGIDGHVTCVSQHDNLPLQGLKGVLATIEIVNAQGQLRRIPALVKEVIRGESDGSLTIYQFHLVDPLTLLRQRVTSRIFRRMSVVQVTRTVLGELRRNDPRLGRAFDFVTQLDEGRHAQREFTMQYNESVTEFLVRLWKRAGISFFFRPAASEEAPPIELVLFDDARLLAPNAVAATLRYHRIDGTEQQDAIVLWAEASRLVGNRGDYFSHDYKAHRVDQASSLSAIDQGEDGNDLAALLEEMRIELPHAGDSYEDFMRQANLRMDRHHFESHCVHGLSGSRDMAVGAYHEVTGHGLLDLGSKEGREFIITSVHHRAQNNRKDLGERLAKLIQLSERSPGWAGMEPFGDDDGDPDARHRYLNSFTAVRRDMPIVPYFDARTDLPPMPRLRVMLVGPSGEVVHTDELGRVKVMFLGLRPEDHEHAQGAGTNRNDDDSAWIQVDLPWAGNGMGFLFPPRAGMIGVCEFENGDPDRPVLVSMHYSGSNRPPRLNATDGIPKTRYQSGIQSQEIHGVRYGRLVFDDSPGQPGIQLASQQCHTQLNLGWNTHPRTEGRGQARREGFELRTDGWGAMRAANGLLITTEARPEAQAHITDMAETVDRLAQGQQQHEHLADAARQAQAQQAGDQDEVAQALKDQNKQVKGQATTPESSTRGEFETPHLTLASPAGLQTSTQGSTHVASTEHNALTSGGHTSVSAGKSLLASAKEAVRLFAYRAGMKLVAASADIDITALKDSVNVLAKLNITQTANRITISAEKEVVVNGGGSITRWNEAGVTTTTGGTCRQQAASHVYTGPVNGQAPQIKPLDVALKETPPENKLAFSLQPIPGPAPSLMAGQPYTLLKNGAQVEQGRLDEYGRLTIDKAEKGAVYQVKLPNGTVHDMPVAQERMASDPDSPDGKEHQLSNKGYRADGQAADARVEQRDRGTAHEGKA